ncbi:MAG TPA: hypothetical protein VGS79_04905 [Puia sp.]|nr:hypothetical protein [Puia sp.]
MVKRLLLYVPPIGGWCEADGRLVRGRWVPVRGRWALVRGRWVLVRDRWAAGAGLMGAGTVSR